MVNQGRKFFLIIMFMSIIGQFGTEVYLPSMPTMAIAFGVPIYIVQLTIAVYVLGYATGSLIYGTLSDKCGRKPVIFWCLVIGSVGSFLCCISFNIQFMFVGRFIQGLGFSGVSVVTRSITRDIAPDKESLSKISSKMGMMYASAISFAPVIGGYIQKYLFWRMNFILLLVMAIVAIYLCRHKMEETILNKRNLNLRTMLGDYIEVLTNKQFLLYNAISSLTLCGVVAYQTKSSYLLQMQLGVKPVYFGYTTVFVTGALFLGNLFNSRVMQRRGIEKMVLLGCAVYIVSGTFYVITGLFDYMTVHIILISIALYMFAAGIIYPNCSSGAMSIFNTKAGTAASIYNCFQMIGATFGSIIVSAVHYENQLTLGIMFVLIGLISIICAQVLQIKVIKQVIKV